MLSLGVRGLFGGLGGCQVGKCRPKCAQFWAKNSCFTQMGPKIT